MNYFYTKIKNIKWKIIFQINKSFYVHLTKLLKTCITKYTDIVFYILRYFSSSNN